MEKKVTVDYKVDGGEKPDCEQQRSGATEMAKDSEKNGATKKTPPRQVRRDHKKKSKREGGPRKKLCKLQLWVPWRLLPLKLCCKLYIIFISLCLYLLNHGC